MLAPALQADAEKPHNLRDIMRRRKMHWLFYLGVCDEIYFQFRELSVVLHHRPDRILMAVFLECHHFWLITESRNQRNRLLGGFFIAGYRTSKPSSR